MKPGGRVAYGVGPIGAYSEARVMPADRLVVLPDGISDRQRAAIVLKGPTPGARRRDPRTARSRVLRDFEIARAPAHGHAPPCLCTTLTRSWTNVAKLSGKGAMQGRQTVRRFASIGVVALALGARAQRVEAQSPITRVHGIATGLAASWHPPHDDDQVTVRISFTRAS